MAWKRQPKSEPELDTTPKPSPSASPPATPMPRRETTDMEKIVNIGQSVQIKGELSGNEDLTIEGMVDGKIMLKDHNLTIGANGRITAEVHAKTVVVVGQISGNITADDKVEIAPSGSVEGDIRAPRVAISDGARFKGSIDMGGKAAATTTSTSPSTSATKPGGLSQSPSREMPRSARAAEG
jgi:cytoskeletal protein CcmA (bactofilin family)